MSYIIFINLFVFYKYDTLIIKYKYWIIVCIEMHIDLHIFDIY